LPPGEQVVRQCKNECRNQSQDVGWEIFYAKQFRDDNGGQWMGQIINDIHLSLSSNFIQEFMHNSGDARFKLCDRS